MGGCGSKVPINAESSAAEGETPSKGDDPLIRINIEHVSGVTDGGEWTLNNIIAVDGNGTIMRHSEDAIILESYQNGRSFAFDCASNVRFVAFASQDMKSACIQINTPSDLAVPSDAFETIHFSNGKHACTPWDAECNFEPTKWAYTVVPLHPKGMDKSKIRPVFHASWSELSSLRSDGF